VNCVPQGVIDCLQSTTPKTAARDCPQSTTPGSQFDLAEVTAEFADECVVDLHEVDLHEVDLHEVDRQITPTAERLPAGPEVVGHDGGLGEFESLACGNVHHLLDGARPDRDDESNILRDLDDAGDRCRGGRAASG